MLIQIYVTARPQWLNETDLHGCHFDVVISVHNAITVPRFVKIDT